MWPPRDISIILKSRRGTHTLALNFFLSYQTTSIFQHNTSSSSNTTRFFAPDMEKSTTSHSPDDEKTHLTSDIETTQAQVDSSNIHVDNVDNEVEPLHRPGTPVVCKYVGHPDKLEHTHNKDSVAGNCRIKNIDNFEDYYLRNVEVTAEHKDKLKLELDALRNYQGSEAGMYKYVAKLFTKAGLLLRERG